MFKKISFSKIGCFFLALLMLCATACQTNPTPTPTPTTGGSNQTEAPTNKEEITTVKPNNNDNNTPTVTYDPPIIWDLSTYSSMQESGVHISSQGGFGQHRFVTVNGTAAMELQYKQAATYQWPDYCVTISTRSPDNRLTEEYQWLRIKYMTTDTAGSPIQLVDTAYAGFAMVASANQTSSSQGQFVYSTPVSMGGDFRFERLFDNRPVAIAYDSPLDNSKFYIAEMLWFNSEDAAWAYCNDEDKAPADHVEMIWAPRHLATAVFGNYAAGVSNQNTGKFSVDQETGLVSLQYNNENFDLAQYGRYGFFTRFSYQSASNGGGSITPQHKYVRIAYSAKNPSGVSSTTLALRRVNNSSGDVVTASNITNTNGKVVLTETLRMKTSLVKALVSEENVAVQFGAMKDGGDYRVAGVYFFTTKAEAEAFSLTPETSNVTVAGKDLSTFTIVLPADSTERERATANYLQAQIKKVTGDTLSIVKDCDAAPTANEILIGFTNRQESKNAYSIYLDNENNYGKYSVTLANGKIVFAAYFATAWNEIPRLFARYYLHSEDQNRPASFNIDKVDMTGSGLVSRLDIWSDATNVANPNIFTDSFSTEANGANAKWWVEEGADNDWTIQNGKYVSQGSDYDLTFLHTFAKNAVFSADLIANPKTAGKGFFGLQLRYVSEYAYVRGGYDFNAGCWYIEYREGEDFPAVRVTSKQAAVTAGSTYRITLTVDNGAVKMSVNATEILSATVPHVTPGKIAVYAYDVAVSMDNASVTFSSGEEGVILKDIVHTVIPAGEYMEGGTVLETSNDGKLHYTHYTGACYYSTDNGKTWIAEEQWDQGLSGSYTNILRLANGHLIQLTYQTINSQHGAWIWTSKDGGKTWTTTGFVTANTDSRWSGSMSTGNMNDKFTQIDSGRIFLVLSRGNMGTTVTIEGYKTNNFCDIFYSDNNGKTWTRSKTSTYSMAGAEKYKHITEGKVIECADGTLRFIAPWTEAGSVLYSESSDRGVTWGAIQKMQGFDNCRSSMGIYEDPTKPFAYYMTWIYTDLIDGVDCPRSRLALAYTEDGKNWVYVGDIWWWESEYLINGVAPKNHLVDPFIYVTETHVIVGSGLGEKSRYYADAFIASHHQAQRQHIWSIPKTSLTPYAEWPFVSY